MEYEFFVFSTSLLRKAGYNFKQGLKPNKTIGNLLIFSNLNLTIVSLGQNYYLCFMDDKTIGTADPYPHRGFNLGR